jgi:hypothetical protein
VPGQWEDAKELDRARQLREHDTAQPSWPAEAVADEQHVHERHRDPDCQMKDFRPNGTDAVPENEPGKSSSARFETDRLRRVNCDGVHDCGDRSRERTGAKHATRKHPKNSASP